MIRTATTSEMVTESQRRQALREQRRAALLNTRRERQKTRNRRAEGLRKPIRIATPLTPPGAEIDVPIHALGAMIELAATFNHRGAAIDAAKVAETTLAVLLRTYWALVTGRAKVNPKLENVALKLYQRNAIDKPSLRLLQNMTVPNGQPARPHEMVLVSRVLLDVLKAEVAR